MREWSSLIGIVTAIVGNILISFALNIQRYAHLRLSREGTRRRRQWSGKTKNSGPQSYGTYQNAIAEERAEINLTAPAQEPANKSEHADGHDGDHGDADKAISLHSLEIPEKQGPAEEKKTYLRSPYWWAGIFMMTIGEAGNFIAYGFAPASIVSPLGVVALVSNCIIAPYLLKEQFRQRDFWGVATAIAGAVVIVISAKNSETKMGPDDVWSAITRWEFETYLGITAVMIIALMWASGRFGDRSVLIDLGLVGLFGGYTALSTKGVASLLSDTLWRTLTFPVTYLLVFVLVATALMQIRYVNRALQRFDSTQVIPVQFVLFTISVIVGSAILYGDFRSAGSDRIGKFVGGCILTFLGVYLITSRRKNEEGFDPGDDLHDEEAGIDLVDEERYCDEEDEVESGDEDMQKRRKSSISIIFDDIPGRRSSRQPRSPKLEPQTPSRISSYNSSAISPNSSPPPEIVANPWQSAGETTISRRPQPPPSTISSPILPSVAQTPAPATPHSNGPPSAQLPSTNLTPARPPTLSRRSIAYLTPGPILSPLSSSMSAVVADSIRKGVDSPSSARRRPRLSGLRKIKSQRGTVGAAASSGDTPTASTPLKASQLPEDAVDTDEHAGAEQSRSQNLRETLSDFFKLRRARSEAKGKARGSHNEET